MFPKNYVQSSPTYITFVSYADILVKDFLERKSNLLKTLYEKHLSGDISTDEYIKHLKRIG